MDNWKSICIKLSAIFSQNSDLNFNIKLSPEEVAQYVFDKVLFVRVNTVDADKLEAALFITIDGECGFIASHVSPSTYRFLGNEFKSIVVSLPEELQTKLWCRIQKNNTPVQKMVERFGFVMDSESDTAYYFKYKGG